MRDFFVNPEMGRSSLTAISAFRFSILVPPFVFIRHVNEVVGSDEGQLPSTSPVVHFMIVVNNC